jgi:hypothetical protein
MLNMGPPFGRKMNEQMFDAVAAVDLSNARSVEAMAAREGLSADARTRTASALSDLSGAVDALMAGSIQPEAVSEDVNKYLRFVERAASDLGSRRAREQVFDKLLGPILGDH